MVKNYLLGRYSISFESSGVQTALPNMPDNVIESLSRPMKKELDMDARAVCAIFL